MNICFIGGGNMATALIGGLIKRGYAPAHLRVIEVSQAACTKLHDEFSIRATTELSDAIPHSHVIILAVKPQQLREVTRQLAPLLTEGHLIISIAAGIRAADLADWLGTRNIVRVMPNTPALIRKGISGLYALPEVTSKEREHAQHILAAVGSTLWLDDETKMDGITAVSGSGPAYVFYFLEALQQGAQELGFNAADARRLAIDTVLGAAKLAESSSEPASELRARVTSKNGTTERALLCMEAHQIKQHLIEAMHAAAARSAELGDELGGH